MTQSTSHTKDTSDQKTGDHELGDHDTGPSKTAPVGRRVRSFLLGIVGVFLSLGVIGWGIALLMVQNPLQLPGPLNSYIARTVQAEVSPALVSFGQLRLGLTPEYQPYVLLDDLRIQEDGQGIFFDVTHTEIGVDFWSLMRRAPQITKLETSGISIEVTRDTSGAFSVKSISPADVLSDQQTFLPFASVLLGADELFRHPALARLSEANARNVRVLYRDGQTGQALTFDGGQLRMTQSGEMLSLSAQMALLGGGADLSSVSIDFDLDRTVGEVTFGANVAGLEARTLAGQSPALAWMQVLDAPISGAFRATITEDGLGPLDATLSLGAGVLAPTDGTQPLKFDGAKTYFTYRPAENRLIFNLLEVDSALGRVVANANAFLADPGTDGARGTEIVTQVSLDQLVIAPQLSGGAQQTLAGASADLKITLDPFRVDLGQFYVPFQGSGVRGSGHVEGLDSGWSISLDLAADELDPLKLAQFWPDGKAVNARAWFDRSVLGGRLSDVSLSLRQAPEQEMITAGSFSFSDGQVRIFSDLPAMEGGVGTGTLDGRNLTLALQRGYFTSPEGKTINIAESTLSVDPVMSKEAFAELDLSAQGSIGALFSALGEKENTVLADAKRRLLLGDGEGWLQGEISFPLKRDLTPADLKIDARGEIREYRSGPLMAGQSIRASTLALTINDTDWRMSGDFDFAGSPGWAEIHTTVADVDDITTHVEGEIEIANATLDSLMVEVPEGYVTGATKAQFEIDLTSGEPAKFVALSNLEGLTLRLDTIGWQKSATARAALEIMGSWGSNPQLESIEFTAPDVEAVARLTTEPGAGSVLEVARLKLQDWLDVSARAVLPSPEEGLRVEILKGWLDMREFPTERTRRPLNTPTLWVVLDELILSDTITLNEVTGRIAPGTSLDGAFTAKVNGDAWIQGVLVGEPSGDTSINISASDAGSVLRASGIIKNVNGGRMEMSLQPSEERGSITGQLQVFDARMADAPALASLLSAVSIVGILEQLDGQGLSLAEVDADFEITPKQLNLNSGSAVGPSLGISLNGVYQFASREMNMEGVISPFYILNSIGAVLTRKGEGLIGFSFTMKGRAADPTVIVNPLSIFTPGMFRNIFRREPQDLD